MCDTVVFVLITIEVWWFVGLEFYFGGVLFFFQAEDGIRDLVRSRGLGDVYKRQRCASGSTRRADSCPTVRNARRYSPVIQVSDRLPLSLIHI